MFDHLNGVAASVFVFFFALVTVLGFAAARWKSADLNLISEWGLGGRRFGKWITWFLLGGDLYTAYTVIAIPAVVYAIGAYVVAAGLIIWLVGGHLGTEIFPKVDAGQFQLRLRAPTGTRIEFSKRERSP